MTSLFAHYHTKATRDTGPFIPFKTHSKSNCQRPTANMLHQPPPPTGPRASGRLASSRIPNRGGIQKRNTTPARVDKDGDLVMDQGSANGRASGRGRGATTQRPAQTRKSGTSESLGARTSRPTRTGIDPSVIRKPVLRGMGSSDTAPRGPRSSLRNVRGRGTTRPTDVAWDEITVKGFTESKAAANPGGGLSEVIAFLERKATHPYAPKVKIMKVCLTLHSARQQRHKISKLSGPPSFQAKLSERRPRFHATAFG